MHFQNHEHFRHLIESSPDPIAIHCEDKLVYINQAGVDLLGLDKEILIGRSRFELTHPDYWDESSEQVNEMLQEGTPSKIREIKLVGKEGQSIEVGIKSAPITYMGKPAIQVIIRDITEQKHAEKAMKESNELVINILESIPDAFFAVNIDWRITYVNQEAEKYIQKKAQELIGKNLWEEFPVLADTKFYHSYHKALTEKVVVEFEEFSPLTKQWYEVRACPTKDGLAIYYRNISERKNTEEKVHYYTKELEVAQSQLQSITDNIEAGVWLADLRTQEYMISQGIEKMYGYPLQLFYDNPTFWKGLVHPDDLHIVDILDKEMFSGEFSVHQYRIIHASGEIRFIRNRTTPIFDQANNLIKIVGVFVDITEYQQMEQSVRESQEWLSTTLKCIGDGVIATDITGKVTFMNPIAETLTACKESDSLGRDIQEVLHLVNGETRQEVTNPVNKVIKEKRIVGLANDTVLINKDGVEIPIDDSAAPILNDQGEMAGIVMVFRDVFERKRYEEKIKHYAFYDALTGLPNRRLFNDRSTIALANAKRNNKTLAMMFIDLDHFKNINDTLGHEIGDLLLKEVANRLLRCVREGDTVARLGGDEFIILLEDISQMETIQVAERIIKNLSCKFVSNGHELFTSPSIGISFYPQDGENVETLTKSADMAMYFAKANGKNNYQLFTSRMNDKAQRKMEIDTGLREALEKNQFQLYYQSKMNLITERFLGVEALIRWHHPELGVISPAEFIPIAEEIGLIGIIGEWVLETACRQCKEWKKAGYPSIRVAVNVSALQFQQPDLITTIKSILARAELDPKNLELEVTESVVQNEETIKKLNELKAMGIYISIDDFGTGYSSLSYLKHLPIDTLKIDQSFIRDIYIDPTDAEIVKTIITLAKSLNLNVIAEGVETDEQLKFLKEHKCDEVQGYLINKPVPSEEFKMIWKKQWKLQQEWI